jgi:ubiquinone/menaquinone biosynthesis C-methylase UbiE
MGNAQTTEGLSASYARWRSSRLGQITDAIERRLLFAMLDPVAGKTVLDVGCGDGELAADLARRGAIVTALDADITMIAAARRRSAPPASMPLGLIVGEAEKLPFDNDTFDRVVAVTLLCFVDDARKAIAEMARVLRPGGRLVVCELGYWSLWAAQRRIRGWLGNPIWRNRSFWTAGELRNFAQVAGLTEIAIRGAIHYPPFGLAAKLLASVDLCMGRHATFGSAFLALSATKPTQMPVPRGP